MALTGTALNALILVIICGMLRRGRVRIVGDEGGRLGWPLVIVLAVIGAILLTVGSWILGTGTYG